MKKERAGNTDEITVVETEGQKLSPTNGDVVEPKKTAHESERVQEGQKWNNRDRSRKEDGQTQKPYEDYKKNIKSDMTSQEESSDPVKIRKQVSLCIALSTLLILIESV